MAVKTQIRDTQGLALIKAAGDLLKRTPADLLRLLNNLTPEHSELVKISTPHAAKMMRIAPNTVARAFRRLEQVGFITSFTNVGKHGLEANSYRIEWNELAIAVDAGRVVEMTDLRELADRDASRRFRRSLEGLDCLEMAVTEDRHHQDHGPIGTKDEGPPKMVGPAPQKRLDRPYQIGWTGPTKMVGPSISPSLIPSSEPSPPPREKSRPTLIDAEWLVVVDELKIFGIWAEAAKACADRARTRGLTPQDVTGLIRFAADKVITLDEQGRPVEQWVMPGQDYLDQYQPPASRLWFWGPPMLLMRIDRHDRSLMGIASDWPPVKGEHRARYDKAQELIANAAKRAEIGQTAPVDQLAHARRQELLSETERLEAAHGGAIEALTLDQVQALVPECERAAFGRVDPRNNRLLRARFLRIYAAHVLANVATEVNP